MPKYNAHEMRWVPAVARPVCYRCGRKLSDDANKHNCRMCYDVFCSSCWGQEIELPPDYNYTTAQPVCVTCSLLTATFPTFTTLMHEGGGGQLLLPVHRAFVVSETVSSYKPGFTGSSDNAGAAPGADAAGNGGVMNRISRFFSSAEPGEGSGAANAPPGKERPFSQAALVPIVLVAFRPLNPDTRLVLGEGLSVPLRCVRGAVHKGDRVVLSVVMDYGPSSGRVLRFIEVIIGVSQQDGLHGADAEEPPVHHKKGGSGAGAFDGDDCFTVDTRAAEGFAQAMRQLVQHCNSHFAFGRSSMALHQDHYADSQQQAPPSAARQ
jgi:hypothetical protein